MDSNGERVFLRRSRHDWTGCCGELRKREQVGEVREKVRERKLSLREKIKESNRYREKKCGESVVKVWGMMQKCGLKKKKKNRTVYTFTAMVVEAGWEEAKK